VFALAIARQSRELAMRSWPLLLVVLACHPSMAPGPLDLGSFRAVLAGRPAAFAGTAVYARCLQTVHVFLHTNTSPKATFTIHPMGSPALGRHPLRPLKAIHLSVSAHQESDGPGPYYMEVIIPPDTVFEAATGSSTFASTRRAIFTAPLKSWSHDT